MWFLISLTFNLVSLFKIFLNESNTSFVADASLVINDFGRFHLSPSKDIVVSKEYHNLKEKTSYLLCYNSKEVIFPIYVRNIKDGDKITVCGITKTIKDLLKDNKIPKRMRDNYLVLSNKDGNFFVPGIIRKETDISKELKMYITIEEKQNENW